MKIYTGTGDRGKTSLFSGERVAKSHERVMAYGEIDELNSVLGALAAALQNGPSPDMAGQIHQIQSDLMAAGALLAVADGVASPVKLAPDASLRLEASIDHMQDKLPDLKSFILPGGHMTAAWAHIARTVCRRAERRMVSLALSTSENPNSFQDVLVYVNRLSDYLFVLARYCNHLAGIEDIPWKQ
jgi:cob(I)alamin adenosyltransferase